MVRLSANQIKLLKNSNFENRIPILSKIKNKEFVKNILENIEMLGFRYNERYIKLRRNIINKLNQIQPEELSNSRSRSNSKSKKFINGMTNEELERVLRAQHLINPYEHIFLLGHGSILPSEYIIVPEKINITFYTEKGTSLSINETNRIFRAFNMTTIRGNDLHIIPEKMLMNNMSVKLLSFFYDNYTNRNLTEFDYSGIITKKNPVPFIKLSEKTFLHYNITPISKKIYINPDYQKKHSMLVDDYDNVINGDYIKILYFGENVYGVMYEKKRGIMIINNMNDSVFKTKLTNFIKRTGALRNHRTLPSIIPESVLSKIRKLSLNFHNNHIIRKSELESNNYRFSLSKILQKIKLHYEEPVDIMCHGILCRVYEPNLTNMSSTVLESSRSPLLPENRETRGVPQLIRTNSSKNEYINRFENIYERFVEDINSLIQNNRINSSIRDKITNILREIFSFEHTHGYLLEKHVVFMDVIINNKPKKMNTYINRIRETELYQNE